MPNALPRKRRRRSRKVEKEVANLKCATCTRAHGVTGVNEENTSNRVTLAPEL